MTSSLFFLLSSGALALSILASLMSATQAAYQISSKTLLEQYTEPDKRVNKMLAKILNDLEAHMIAVSFTRIFAESIAAMLLVIAFMQVFNSGWIVALAATLFIGVLSFFIVAVGPKSYGNRYPHKIILFLSPIVRFLRITLTPVVNLALLIIIKREDSFEDIDEKFKSEQLLSLVDKAAEQDLLEEDEQDIIHSVLEFGDTIVREVMVPRTDMVTVSAADSIKEVFEELLRSRFSRIPVKANDSDDIVGVAYLRDVAGYMYRHREDASEQAVKRIMKAPLFVPDLQRADDLLRLMQSNSNHLALVVDEHGGIAGLVTLEDLIEELIGDITDEHDRTRAEFVKQPDGSYVLDAKLELEKFTELFDIDLREEEAQTVSGLVSKLLGRLPTTDDTVDISGVRLQVLEYEKKRQKAVSFTAIPLETDETD